MTLSSSDLIISHLTPGNYASSNTITVNVSTNNSYGYTLIAKVGDKDNSSLSNNSLVNTESSDTTFTSLSTTDNITLPNFNDNKWGYTTASTIDTNTTTYSGLLYNVDTIINATKSSTGIPMNNTYPGTNTTNFTIAAKAGQTQASGEYTNVINFRSVANVNTDITINDLRYMQDIASLTDVERQLVISSMVTGTSYQLRDSRDDTTYSIAKLKDGNIWMQDNLALGSTSPITLTNSDTNMSVSSWTLPASTTTGFDGNEASYTNPAINTESKNTEVNLAMGQSGTGKVGVYYNYCAASAGTICTSSNSSNAQYDICPKGWRMPTGGSSGEYQTLRNQYDSDSVFVATLKTPLSGYFSNSAINQDGSGNFWSSTYVNTLPMYNLNVNTVNTNQQDYSARLYGLSVRCVYDATPDMQDATASQLATLMPSIGDTAILNDNRDGSVYNVGRLADGKYWMLDNLALGSTSTITLTNLDTNMVASSWTLPASISTGFNSYTAAQINADYKNTEVSLAMGQSGTGKVGVYYNYCAASAGTYCMANNGGNGNANYDICPSGWRMPTGGEDGEYQDLRDFYNSDSDFVIALRASLSGSFFTSSTSGQNVYGDRWSSTIFDSNIMHRLSVEVDRIGTLSAGYRYYGLSVRCVKQ